MPRKILDKISERPIVVYNTKKKEVIGIFQYQTFITRYLFGDSMKTQLICSALSRKHRINNTCFDFPVALRYANEAQTEQIGSDNWVITKGYPVPNPLNYKGFDSTRISMAEDHCKRKMQNTTK